MNQTIETQEGFKKFVANFWEKKGEIPFLYSLGHLYKDATTGDVVAFKPLTINKESNTGMLAALYHALEEHGPEDSTATVSSKKEALVISLDSDEMSFRFLFDKINALFEKWLEPGPTHENYEVLKNGLLPQKCDLCLVVYQTEDILTEEKPSSIPDIFVRLGNLTARHYKPNEQNLDGIFSMLENLVWTDKGPVRPSQWKDGSATSLCQDKFPTINWALNLIPSDVRITNMSNVRFGAHLGAGTTVMHYGFINFNAGSLGKAMIEGRVSAGTSLGDGTDVGAGAGFLGTLSGGNTIKISTGKNCLIGANAECGIPLGDNCIVSTGTCFSGNTPIMDRRQTDEPKEVKAKELSGEDNLLIRRNSLTGVLEVLSNTKTIALNEELHDNAEKKKG